MMEAMIRRRFPWLLLALATTSCVRLGPHAGADGPALDGRVDTWRPSRPDGALRDGGPPDADLSVGLDASGDAPGPVDGPLVSRDIPRDIPLVSLDIPLAAEGLLVPDGPSALLALRAVANQTAVFETTPITTVDVDNFTGDDKTANGVPINYSCRFDRQVDNVVSSAALPCLDLGAGATFDSATGTLNWTPRLGALGSYEIAIRGTAGLATDTVIFVITVVADHRPTGLAVGQTVRVSVGLGGEANGDSNGHTVGVSANGRFVVYTSVATNLVTGDTNGVADVFVTDVRTGETTRVSVDSNGVQGDGPSDGSVLGPAQSGIGISDDGYTVVFMSSATNFVTNDANGVPDIFWHDRRTGETQLASRSLAGVTSTANGASQRAQVSADGRYIVFQSAGSNLVAGDTNGKDDCFRFDTQNSQTRVVSRDSAGVLGNDHCNHPRISSDGNLVAFYSLANNLVAGDTNNTFDAFLHNVSQGVTRRISQRSDGTEKRRDLLAGVQRRSGLHQLSRQREQPDRRRARRQRRRGRLSIPPLGRCDHAGLQERPYGAPAGRRAQLPLPPIRDGTLHQLQLAGNEPDPQRVDQQRLDGRLRQG